MKTIDILAAHLLGDYVFQTNEEAMEKLFDPDIRAEHVTKYVGAFLPFILLTSSASWTRKLSFLFLLWITHFAIDSKRWVPNEDWAPGNILNDQALHAVQLAILIRILK